MSKKKKSKSSASQSRSKLLLIALAITAFAIVLAVAAIKVDQKNEQKSDKEFFSLVEDELNDVGRQVFPQSTPVQEEKCSMTGQGPWNDGKLACSISLTYNLGQIPTGQIAQVMQAARDRFGSSLDQSKLAYSDSQTLSRQATPNQAGEYSLSQTYYADLGQEDSFTCFFDAESVPVDDQQDPGSVSVTLSCLKHSSVKLFKFEDKR